MSENENKGLASADEETKRRVASAGGSAPHDERGLQAADEETKERVAQAGGEASHGGGGNQTTNEKKASWKKRRRALVPYYWKAIQKMA